MMKKIVVFFTAWFATQTFAAGSEDLVPYMVGCFPHGTCYIGVSPPTTKSTCPNKNQIRFDINNPGSSSQYAAALAATMAGKKINSNLTDACIDGFPVPDWLHVLK